VRTKSYSEQVSEAIPLNNRIQVMYSTCMYNKRNKRVAAAAAADDDDDDDALPGWSGKLLGQPW